MRTLIGVTGKAQHGKSTVGQYLVDEYGFEQYAFADTLKDMALALNPVISLDVQPGDTVNVAAFARLSNLVEDWGWEEAKGVPEVRSFLQRLGTEGARDHLGPDVWVDAVVRKMLERGRFFDGQHGRAVLTDVRFNNEADFIHEEGGYILKVVRPGMADAAPPHLSEVPLADAYVTHTIEAYTLTALYEEVDRWLVALSAT